MSEPSRPPSRRALLLLARSLLAILVLFTIASGLWALDQVFDSVIVLGRDFVNLPFSGTPVDVWTYHDIAYVLLWVSYVALVTWEVTPWRPGHLTNGKVVAAFVGFVLLTAGLWLTQDTMNAVLTLHRSTIDLPFFVMGLDLYQSRDLILLLTTLSYVGFYATIRVTRSS